MQSFFRAFLPIICFALNLFSQIYIARYLKAIGLLKSVIWGFIHGAGWLFVLELLSQDKLASSIANIITYTALSYAYFHFVNLSETARRIRILRELVDSKGGLTMQELLRSYNAREIIDKRIDRLMKNGQIRYSKGRYYINKPVMLLAAKIIIIMKVLILGKRSEFNGVSS